MDTLIEAVDGENPSSDKCVKVIKKASEIIKKGGLVAFPTETVYGLGANALDPVAVKKIYMAKGRPSDNPLIVHISDISELYNFVAEVSEKAKALIKEFWPGPLTLIFKKTDKIPFETSGGLNTVAVRFPENKTALLLIKKSGVPIAAPSANSSGKPSPTRASHVIFDLNSKIDMIIDGGSAEFGLESTILDVSSEKPCLLRPGVVTKQMIESLIGEISIDKAITEKLSQNERPKAPGMKYTHYSPVADVIIVDGKTDDIVKTINELVGADIEKGISVGVIATIQTINSYRTDNKNLTLLEIGDRSKPETIASNLFEVLRKCDYLNISKVYIESFNEDGIGFAIMNRLKKAAGYNIINV